jgi:hypothetical protein
MVNREWSMVNHECAECLIVILKALILNTITQNIVLKNQILTGLQSLSGLCVHHPFTVCPYIFESSNSSFNSVSKILEVNDSCRILAARHFIIVIRFVIVTLFTLSL